MRFLSASALALGSLALGACRPAEPPATPAAAVRETVDVPASDLTAPPLDPAGSAAALDAGPPRTRTFALFAAGCFWCAEADFEKVPGVVSVISGYTGGRTRNPTYEQVSRTNTGHYEAVRVNYDSSRVTYAQLLDVFWRNHDPLTPDRQFCDVGESYRAAIFYRNASERASAEARKQAVGARLGRPVTTAILPAAPFYPAEDYHQDYYKKNRIRYTYYRASCGRDQRLEQLFGATAAR